MLDLSGNKIQFIDGATFVDIPDLEIFKCNHCQLFQVCTTRMSHFGELPYVVWPKIAQKRQTLH